jgi:hypothetical protein
METVVAGTGDRKVVEELAQNCFMRTPRRERIATLENLGGLSVPW